MAAKPPAEIKAISFAHLDMARGLAALAVLLGHLRSFVFVSYGELKSHSPIDIGVWFATSFGHQAVMIFFVLSGFFITRSIAVDDEGRGFSWPIYLIKRLTRLWIVLIPCLCLTLVCDRLGMLNGGMSFYGGDLFSKYNSGPTVEGGGVNLSISTFLGNLLFLQNIMVPIFGSNGPLWSLANEFWYYLLFPLLFIAITYRQNRIRVMVNVILFVVIGIFVGKYIMLSFVVWIGGALAYLTFSRGWYHYALRTRLALGISSALLVISLVVSKWISTNELATDLFIGLAATIFVLVLACRDRAGTLYSSIAGALADMSYTMYLVHFPFMALIISVAFHNYKYSNSISGYLVFVGVGMVTIIYCYVVYWLFERHTAKIRRYFIRRFNRISIGAVRTET